MRLVYRPNHIDADENGMVDITIAGPKLEPGRQATYVISDIMPDTRHMADGKHYSSKSAFRAATKAAGCIEIGNETATVLKPRKPIPLDPQKRRDDIKRTIYDLKNGRRG